ncbi:hypothetical protein I317_02269 [Kwoniella heveanensis CBS 569]|uniref:Uncharacterized protein n=1 Tax=Kwoniella heveanensis BCC8398 TaxID=1296120 RepID=A0A1B9GWE0_9TREE|nr:hypothetical protein I316_03258 [Kwoniella heveanensis BCC8398]OCF43827.1 hypothetical protein I317_02269 [Kwoniella heveanensis CBS 569]
MSLRTTLRPFTRLVQTPLAVSARSRSLHATALRATQTGYGDPTDEKAANDTPLPSSTPDPNPSGQGKGPGSKTGVTDPEVGNTAGEYKSGGSGSSSSSSSSSGSGSGSTGSVGNAGGEKGAGNAAEEHVSSSEIKETKKVGQDPKKEEVGGAGPIGG